jgi:CRP/FNR family cyclic AMP-dependent transcriptional regulator
MDRTAAFIRSQSTKHFDQNEILIYQDEKPQKLFAIRSGFVKVHTIAPNGADQIVWLAKKYDFIPLDFLFGKNETSPFFYTAFTNVDVFAVDRNTFLDFVKNDNEALMGISEALAIKYSELLMHLNAVQQSKATNKVLDTLNFLASRFASDEKKGHYEVSLPLTHQDVASLAGLTRETTSIELRRLKDKGLIDYTSKSFTVYTTKV